MRGWKTSRRHKQGRTPYLYSVALHSVILVGMWLTNLIEAPVIEFVTYEIEIVSPPAAVVEPEPEPDPDPEPPAPEEELVIETPDPEVADPEDAPIPEPEAEPEPQPEEPEPTPEEEPAEAEPEDTEDETPAPAPDTPVEEVEESGEDINVRMEGLQRDYPEYYNNIIFQINRCLRLVGAAELKATVYFVINPEGTVSDIRTVAASGDVSFDFELEGAVECAGSRTRFGPLPEEINSAQLPIIFTLDRRGGE